MEAKLGLVCSFSLLCSGVLRCGVEMGVGGRDSSWWRMAAVWSQPSQLLSIRGLASFIVWTDWQLVSHTALRPCCGAGGVAKGGHALTVSAIALSSSSETCFCQTEKMEVRQMLWAWVWRGCSGSSGSNHTGETGVRKLPMSFPNQTPSSHFSCN